MEEVETAEQTQERTVSHTEVYELVAFGPDKDSAVNTVVIAEIERSINHSSTENVGGAEKIATCSTSAIEKSTDSKKATSEVILSEHKAVLDGKDEFSRQSAPKAAILDNGYEYIAPSTDEEKMATTDETITLQEIDAMFKGDDVLMSMSEIDTMFHGKHKSLNESTASNNDEQEPEDTIQHMYTNEGATVTEGDVSSEEWKAAN